MKKDNIYHVWQYRIKSFNKYGPYYPSLTHIKCLAIHGLLLEKISYDNRCYMTCHEDHFN